VLQSLISHVTISKPTISRYIIAFHRQILLELRVRTDAIYMSVYLQVWVRNPMDRQYWIVEMNGSITQPVNRLDTYNHLKRVLEREELRIKSWKAGLEQGPAASTLSFTELRPWLERTG